MTRTYKEQYEKLIMLAVKLADEVKSDDEDFRNAVQMEINQHIDWLREEEAKTDIMEELKEFERYMFSREAFWKGADFTAGLPVFSEYDDAAPLIHRLTEAFEEDMKAVRTRMNMLMDNTGEL